MAVQTFGKKPYFWNYKWLQMSTYSLLSGCDFQHEYSKLTYASMAGSKNPSPSSACSTCEYADIVLSNIARDKKCTYTRKTGLIPLGLTSAHETVATSRDMAACRKVVGLAKDLPNVVILSGCSIKKERCFSHVLSSSHAMAQLPLGMYRGFLYGTVHIRAHSSKLEPYIQHCPCGKYNSKEGFLICPLCNTVQAPNPAITYFQIFDLDENFELDLKDLEVKYKSLMKMLHPDLSHGKSTEEKENYAQSSALVTTAYNELLKPVSRATYMLKLRGVHVEEEGTVTDSELIMEVMEIRETLQSSPDRKTLEQLHKAAMARMGEWSEAFKSALQGGDNTKAVGALQRMSYFGRVCEDINRELL